MNFFRTHKKTSFTLLVVSALALTAFVLWRQVSALMVLRRFIAETGIPLEVRSASWDIRLHELFKGQIRELNLDVIYKPLNLPISFKTPVNYVRRGQHWSIRLLPEIKIADFPPAEGKVDLELDSRVTKRNPEGGPAVRFDLHETKPLQLAFSGKKISLGAWRLRGIAQPLPEWKATIDAKFEKVSAASVDDEFKAAQLTLEAKLAWPQNPPLPVKAAVNAHAEGLALQAGSLAINESDFLARMGFSFDGERFEAVDISVDKPFKFSTSGTSELGSKGRTQAKFSFDAPMNELVDKRLSVWLNDLTPALRRAKATGQLKLGGNFFFSPERGVSVNADLALRAEKLELPNRDLYLENVALKMPLAYPGVPGWGGFTVETAEFQSVKLKRLKLASRLSKDGVELTTENAEGKDEPIHQLVWGGSIDVSNLYAHFGGAQGTEFAASLKGGPFKISEIQKDLCLMAKSSLAGQVSFDYPRIAQDAGSLHLIGATNLEVFNGKADIGDLHVFLEKSPRIRFSFGWHDLDLRAIGDWTNFGDMRGSLDGAFKDVTLKISPVGPIPMQYVLQVQGRPRSGKKISFYGRALDNTLLLLGSPTKEIPGIANWILHAGITVRNWFPTTVEYLGFEAKNDGEWTEVRTYDPPESKKRYLLYGSTGFTIPLETHGVYPVVLKTDAFHGYLIGMLERFAKERQNNEKNRPAETECTPLW